jgi:site-specific recombinase XerD
MKVLRMTSLTKRPGSANWHYRRTIPADVQRIIKKSPSFQRPRGWYNTHIIVTTKTADSAIAKTIAADIASDVERQFTALRGGPKPLTTKQVAMLSGNVYRAYAALEDNPGLTQYGWLTVAETNRIAQDGAFGLGAKLGITRSPEDKRRLSMEARFGGLADATLRHEAIITDGESRWKLIEAMARDLTEVAEKLSRNADGDYSPDIYANRFPAAGEIGGNAPTGKKLTELIDAWYAAAGPRGTSKRTAHRWKAVMARFIEWLGHDDISRATAHKVQAWGDERNAAGTSTKTINDTDFAALRAVFEWGKKRGWVSANPAKEAKIEGRRKAKTRDPYFAHDEIAAILAAASAVKGTQRENPKTTAAKHWIPWLCGYSGARVLEMIQLRKEDVRKERGGWIMRLTPEAGGIKTNVFRDVPVHEHLIANGFLKFVTDAKAGPLFCEFGADGTTAGPAGGVYKRVLTFVRSIVSDKRVQPNHAWRYSFKTYGYEAGIDSLVLDAICGHAGKTKGQDYTKITLKKRMEAMEAFPRYKLTANRNE